MTNIKDLFQTGNILILICLLLLIICLLVFLFYGVKILIRNCHRPIDEILIDGNVIMLSNSPVYEDDIQ